MADRYRSDDLAALTVPWDEAAALTFGADPFCAFSDWSFSAAESFAMATPPTIVVEGNGLCGLRSVTQEDGARVLVGLDPVWGFATPVVGTPDEGAAALTGALRSFGRNWDFALITAQDLEWPGTLAMLGRLERHRLLRGPVQERLRADVGGGFDDWWGRRSSRFRQRLRRIEKDALARGVEVVDVSELRAEAVLDRILAVEAQSWKAADDTGLNSPDMARFYRAMAERLAAGGRLRALFARLDDADIGYVLGGVRGSTYRGLQLSYVADAGELSLGHLLQLEQLRRLDSSIEIYDLGMDMEYKRRWIDRVDETMAIIVQR